LINLSVTCPPQAGKLRSEKPFTAVRIWTVPLKREV